MLDGDELNATLVCLSTGGRWSEVSNLKAEHIINQMVTFMKTKTEAQDNSRFAGPD